MRQKQSWEITEEFWDEVKHLIPQRQWDETKTHESRPGGGRKPIEPRKPLEAIFYIMRTGIQWKALSKEFGGIQCDTPIFFVLV